MLAKVPPAEDAAPAAAGYQEVVTQMRRAYAQSDSERQQAEEEGVALRDRVRAAYPFHPALIDLMRERWAAIPDFQRTRGALRFLAACLRSCHREGKSRIVLGPGEVPIHDDFEQRVFSVDLSTGFREEGDAFDHFGMLSHQVIPDLGRAVTGPFETQWGGQRRVTHSAPVGEKP